MTKRSGLGMLLLVSGVDMSGDTQAINNMGCPRSTFESNGLDVLAMERLYGRYDGNMSLTSYFNKAAGQAHALWSTLPRTDVDLMVAFRKVAGAGGAAMRAKQVGYDGSRTSEGMLTFGVETQSNASDTAGAGQGLEYGWMLTAGSRTDVADTNGPGIDLGTGSTVFGLRAWVQVTALDGDDCTITLQGSSDNGAGDAFAAIPGGAFTEVTAAPAGERIQTAPDQTIERYIRVATSGAFDSVSFAVLVYRNEESPA